MNQIIPVTFHQDSLALIEHKGQPFVAMKPVVENMGLAWHGQFQKLRDKFNSVIQEIGTTGGDGKKYDMICLPLRKIPAFMYSINPNKVKPELRGKILQYQEECDDVLWQYWTKGYVGNAGQKPPTYNQQLAAGKERIRLLEKLKREGHKDIREAIYQQIRHASDIMGIDPPEMESIRPIAKRLTPWEEQQKLDLMEPVKRSTMPEELWGMEEFDGREED